MNLLNLRYFISIAECASFTKAAEHLFVTQPTLSRSVLDLEEELGVQLFSRDHRSLRLTAAGVRLLNEAKEIIEKCDELLAIARQNSKTETHTLSIGYQGFIDTAIMYNAVNALSEMNPEIRVQIIRGNTAEILSALQEKTCDIIFTMHACVESLQNVEYVWLKQNRLQAVVPLEHRLAGQNSVTVSDLANERFILLKRGVSPPTLDYVIGQCIQNDFSPTAYDYAEDPEAAVLLVSSGKGIAFLHSMCNVPVPADVKLLDIEGISHSGLDLVAVFRANNNNAMLPVFISKLTAQAFHS